MALCHQAFSEKASELRTEENYLAVKTDLVSLSEDAEASPKLTEEESLAQDDTSQCFNIHQLQPGMCLTKDVKTDKGVLLLSAGFVLNQNTIRRLFELDDVIAEHEYYIAKEESSKKELSS